MSLTFGPINEGKQAAEEAADHLISRVEQDTPGMFRQLLDVFAEYEIAGSFALGLRKKDGQK